MMSWKDFFVKKQAPVTSGADSSSTIIMAPFSGTIVSLDDVPDEVFSQRMIGDGIALHPSQDTAEVVLEELFHIFTTNHAISYECANGLEIIVHIGINTVELKGKHFVRVVKKAEGKEPMGTPLVRFDREAIETAGFSMISPIIISGGPVKKIEILADTKVEAGQPLLKILTN